LCGPAVAPVMAPSGLTCTDRPDGVQPPKGSEASDDYAKVRSKSSLIAFLPFSPR
jgi:hypothetical protein